MNTETFIKQEMQANTKLRLFSLYVDFAASVRARWASGTITKMAGPRWKTRSEMWNLDSFKASQEKIGRIILQDAAEADVLIVGLSSPSKLIPGTNRLLPTRGLGKRVLIPTGVCRWMSRLWFGQFGERWPKSMMCESTRWCCSGPGVFPRPPAARCSTTPARPAS
jgi:hypothetical protein